LAKYKSNNSKLFRDIALDWLQIQDDLSDKTIVTTAQRLNRCIEEFGYIPISEIDSIQMLTFLQKIENRGYIETAKRTKSIISRVYEYANILNLTNINPTTGLSRILKNKKSNNFPFVKKIEDMRHLMFDISNYQGMIEVQFALKIAAYTFVRPSELRFSRWNELEGDIWRMPAERTKLKRGRLVPLSTQVKTLISSSTCPLNRFLESLKSDLRELAQQPKDKNKIYSLHEPDVSIIAQGKDHKQSNGMRPRLYWNKGSARCTNITLPKKALKRDNRYQRDKKTQTV
jgi:integrase